MDTDKPVYDIGIDLGTTYSSIAFYDPKTKQPKLVTDQANNDQIPSWVCFDNANKQVGGIMIGTAAKRVGKYSVVYDIKRIIGRKEVCEIPLENRSKWPFRIDQDSKYGEQKVYLEVNIATNSRFAKNEKELEFQVERFQPEEISGIITHYLVNLYKDMNFAIGNVVFTVPVEFNDTLRESSKLACEIAGLDVDHIEFRNEPSMAIYQYKTEFKKKLSIGSKVVVIDFGGGTLDITCCKMKENDNIEVIANGGDNNLGGNDFDFIMMELIKDQLLLSDCLPDLDYYESDEEQTPEEKNILNKRLTKLRKEAERIKIALSEDISCNIDYDALFDKEDFEDEDEEEIYNDVEITRKMFEEECRKKKFSNFNTRMSLVEKFHKVIREVCQENGKEKFDKDNKVELVLLIGGTCKIKMIREIIKEFFDPKTFASEDFDPMRAVVKGAASYAHTKVQRGKGMSEVHDTIPRNIGLQSDATGFTVMCKAGTPLPILPEQTQQIFNLIKSETTEFTFKIYQGNFNDVQIPGMKLISNFVLKDLEKSKRSISVLVKFGVDRNGFLTVSAETDPEESREKKVASSQFEIKIDLKPTDEYKEQIKNHCNKFKYLF